MSQTAQVSGGAGATITRPTGTSGLAAAPEQPVEDNSHAGQGSVMLDIGGEIGALVVYTTAELEGIEIEIRPTGSTPFADGHRRVHDHPSHPNARDHDHHHDDDHDDRHDHGPHDHGHHDHGPHDHDHGDRPHEPAGQLDGHRLIHVAVLKRPSMSGDRYAAVFPELHEGTYELYRRPADPVALTVSIAGAQVTETRWPGGR